MKNDDYNAYLRSPKWDSLRKIATNRAGSKCEFCGAPGHSVHHVKYPANFDHDHVDNLVITCKKCHELSHGIRRGGIQTMGTIIDCVIKDLAQKIKEKRAK